MNHTKLYVGILTVVFWISAPLAHAYHPAKITVEQAEVKDAPSDSAITKTVMPQGTRVNTTDMPTNGYYRVRSATDTGWVKESNLGFLDGAHATAQPPAPSDKHSQIERMDDRDQGALASERKWGLKVFGGMDFWKVNDLTTQVQSTSLQGGAGFGGELDYFLWKNLGLAFRVEKLSKSATGTYQSDNVSFELSSVPVMAGLDWAAAQGENFSLDLGGYLGGGFSTQVSETDTSQTSSNLTQISATAPTLLLAADVNWHLTAPLWFYGELGYRYLKDRPETAPGTLGTGNAGNLFKDSNGNPVSVALDLSGVVLNFGVRFNF